LTSKFHLQSGTYYIIDFYDYAAHKFDGTFSNPTPFTWVCPLVNPNSEICFYQVCEL